MARKVDWYYHRSGCNTCKKMNALLEQLGIEAKEIVSTGKTKLGPDDALELIGQVNQLIVTRGTKVFEFNLKKDKPSDEEILSFLIGRSGTLRAPAIRAGKTLLVGFQAERFEEFLAGK